MNKIILTIGMASSLLVSSVKEENEYLLSEAIGNIQDLREMIKWDLLNEKLNQNLAYDYLEYLNQAEDLIIEFETKNIQTKYDR